MAVARSRAMVDVHAWAARIERCARAPSLGDAAYLGAPAAAQDPPAPRRAAPRPMRADVGTDLYGATIHAAAPSKSARAGRPPTGAEVRAHWRRVNFEVQTHPALIPYLTPASKRHGART